MRTSSLNGVLGTAMSAEGEVVELAQRATDLVTGALSMRKKAVKRANTRHGLGRGTAARRLSTSLTSDTPETRLILERLHNVVAVHDPSSAPRETSGGQLVRRARRTFLRVALA